MMPISYARHRFPPEVIRHAVWLYLGFTLSYRDVEDLLTERGLIVSNESVRRWVLKFGPVIARNLRGLRPKAYTRWHLDEMVVSISGKQGALSMAKARFLTFSFSPSVTRQRPCACSVNSFVAGALLPRLSSPINRDFMELRFVKLAFRDSMSKAYAPTTARRTRTSQFEDANERCKASNRTNLLSVSFLFMRQSTTHSMFNGIWSAVRRIGGFEPLRINLGMRRQLR
jgi:hypothetical protein